MERDYKDLKNCEICQKPFGITRIRHKCKRCKLIICYECGKSKSIIIGYKVAPAVPHRVCSFCRLDIDCQQETKTKYNTSWAHLSGIAQEWMNKCDVLQELKLEPDAFRKYLEDSEANADAQTLIRNLIEDISNGRADRESFNYSLTEFFFYSQQNKERDVVRRSVENVLKAFYTRYTEQGYTSLLISVVTFLLCFADEENAFYLLCFLNEKIVPQGFWDAYSEPLPFLGLLKEKYMIEKAASAILKPLSSVENMRHFKIVFDKISNVLIGSLMVDIVNFRTQLHVWNEIFHHKSIHKLEVNLVKVMKHSKPYYEHYYGLTLYNYRLFSCRTIHDEVLKNDLSVHLLQGDKDQFFEEFDTIIIEHLVQSRKSLVDSLEILKKLPSEDVTQVLNKIRELVQQERNQKKDGANYINMNYNIFLSVFREIPSLSTYEENDLLNIFKSLDLYNEGILSSRVVSGLIILLVPEDLNTKLNSIFSLFDIDHDGFLSVKEMPQVIAFLSEVLPVLNETNSTYLTFQIHLFELLEKLKKRVKKLQKITPQNFQDIASKYPVFQVATGESPKNMRRTNSLLSYVSMTTNEDDHESIPDPAELEEGRELLEDQTQILNHEEEKKDDERERASSKKEQSLTPIETKIVAHQPQENSPVIIDNSPSINSKGDKTMDDVIEVVSPYYREVGKDARSRESGRKKDNFDDVIEIKTPSGGTPMKEVDLVKSERVVKEISHTGALSVHSSPEKDLSKVLEASVKEEVPVKVDVVIEKKFESIETVKEPVKEIVEPVREIVKETPREESQVIQETEKVSVEIKEIDVVKDTTDITELEVETPELVNSGPKIQPTINPTETRRVDQTRNLNAVEKDNSCKMCNMF